MSLGEGLPKGIRQTLAQIAPSLRTQSPPRPSRAPPTGASGETRAINIKMWNYAANAFA